MSTDRATLDPADEPERDEPEVKEADEEPELEALEKQGVPQREFPEIEEPEDDEPELEALERQGRLNQRSLRSRNPRRFPRGGAMAFRVTGKVNRIYATSDHVFFRLADLPPADTPQDGYFRLSQTHSNYDALYSLALTAAVNRYDLQIRTSTDIDPAQIADVRYMVVDW